MSSAAAARRSGERVAETDWPHERHLNPLDPTGADKLAGMIQGAFGQSLQSLRRYVEEKVAWDAR